MAAPAALRQEFNVTVPYPRIWRAVVDGRIPATREGRRWYLDTADLPEIADTLAKA